MVREMCFKTKRVMRRTGYLIFFCLPVWLRYSFVVSCPPRWIGIDLSQNLQICNPYGVV